LQDRRRDILERWSKMILDAYPADAAGFLLGEKDRFRNPVGHAVRDGIQTLLDGILEDAPTSEMKPALDEIVRIRTVQDIPPSAAVGFVLLLKRAIRDAVGGNPGGEAGWEELSRLDSRVDALALAAFDIHAACREKIMEIRVDSMRRRSAALQKFLDQRYGSLDNIVESTDNSEKGGSGA
jgi:hypothetical protein